MAKSADNLQAEGRELKAAGRLDEAIQRYAEAVTLAPSSGSARHNLAAALGDSGRWAEAESHLRVAMRGGLDAPESWLVLARALQAQGRLEEAEAAFREAARRRSTLYDAHRELAQLAWMRSGDPACAVADIEAAIQRSPSDVTLRVIKAQAQEFSGVVDKSFETLVEAHRIEPANPGVSIVAAHTALRAGRVDAGLRFGAAAIQLAPADGPALLAWSAALLAAGRAEEAIEPIVQVIRRQQTNQTAIAYLATAMRMTGNAQYRLLHDYETLVGAATVSAPPGWADLPAYLTDLGEALRRIHVFREHPFGQSLRHGSQAQNLLQHDHPAIRALPGVLDGPIRAYIARLGRGADPIRGRNLGGYRIQGLWSVQLFPNGFHADHVHPEGWISSAFYVEPVERPGHEGWIKFGQPGTPTAPSLEPDHFVKPEPGMLALFPSYMWHGTVPFGGDRPRLTCAFDLVPAPA